MANTYVIAEIGTGHEGDLTRADELIHAAREAGADCAKFQWVIASEIVHERITPVALPGGPTALYDRFRAVEQPAEFYARLKERCEHHGIDFLCTPFGIESARGLRRLNPDAIKIASPELNHTELLHEVAAYDLPLIISSGVSLLTDIEYALSLTGRDRVTLLHCITAYPAPEDEYNLRVIPSLRSVLGIPVGLSDHSQDPNLVPGLAVALGATTVEKHFTLSRTGSGLDDPIAMDRTMFATMCATLRRIDAVLELDAGHGQARVLAEFETEYGRERVRRVLGDGVKRLSPRESGSYRTTRRSLLACRALARGDVLTADAVAALRSETLAPGLEPRMLPDITGARLARDVAEGGPITLDALFEK